MASRPRKRKHDSGSCLVGSEQMRPCRVGLVAHWCYAQLKHSPRSLWSRFTVSAGVSPGVCIMSIRSSGVV
eukprot:2704905-Pyramimonas_sp.AAC.1